MFFQNAKPSFYFDTQFYQYLEFLLTSNPPLSPLSFLHRQHLKTINESEIMSKCSTKEINMVRGQERAPGNTKY